MVRYCVMWKFKPSDGKTPKELAEDVKEKYESLLGLVPGLQASKSASTATKERLLMMQ